MIDFGAHTEQGKLTLKAARWCAIFEQKLRPMGYHVALTGSALYGLGKGKADIDIIIYPNNDQEPHDEPANEVLAVIGVTKFDVLDLHDYSRDVFSAVAKDGTKIDFWFLE
jgi:hypothetical protein